MQVAPYVSLLVAVLLIYIARGFVAYAQTKLPEGLDNAHPRAQQAKLTGLGARAQGAHMNGFEAFAPFAAAVIACELRRVPVERTAMLSIAFVILRSLYVALYLGNMPTARSSVWGLAALATLALFVLAILGP